MPNNRYVRRKEKETEAALYRLFRKEYKAFIQILKKQDTQKAFFNDMEVLLGRLKDGVVKVLTQKVQVTVQKGSDVNARKFNPSFVIDFNLANSQASRYLQLLEDLHLSDKKGSIAHTTKKEIIKIVDQGINEGLTYTEMAEQIEKQQPFVFSRSRAELIAITEIGRAYEFGNWLPMKDLELQGAIVTKEWITAGDNKVRDTHKQNESDGLISLNQRFSGTGDLYAPAKLKDPFRCRCATGYEVK